MLSQNSELFLFLCPAHDSHSSSYSSVDSYTIPYNITCCLSALGAIFMLSKKGKIMWWKNRTLQYKMLLSLSYMAFLYFILWSDASFFSLWGKTRPTVIDTNTRLHIITPTIHVAFKNNSSMYCTCEYDYVQMCVYEGWQQWHFNTSGCQYTHKIFLLLLNVIV